HDLRGRRVRRVLPGGASTRYAYDAADALVEVDHKGTRVVLERDVMGREIRRGDDAGRFSLHSAYDAADRLVEQRGAAPSAGAPTVLVQRQWRYDAAGRVQRVDDGRWGATTYRYDRVGELVEARRGDRLEVFGYDAAGALQSMLDGLDAGSAGTPWEI